MTHKRFMTNPVTERRIVNGALWLVGACVIVAMLTSCSPYAMGTIVPSDTPSPSATARKSAHLQISTPTPRPSCTVTGFLNFRTSPSRGAAVIRVLTEGERVTVIERGDWLKVSTRNKTGFIYGKYCR